MDPKKILTGSGAIMVSRLAGAGAGFLTQFLLVKLMGPSELGLFYAASSLAAVFGVFLALGYPQLAPRFMARYRNKKGGPLAARFAAHALGEGLAVAVLGALLVAIWSLLWPGLSGDERIAYAIAGVMLLAVVALNITTNLAGGMRAFMLCYVPEGLGRPLLFLAACGLAGVAGIQLSGVVTMLIFAAVTTAITLYVTRGTLHLLPPLPWRLRLSRRLPTRWRVESLQLVLTAVFTNFFADVCIFVTTPFLSHGDTAVFGLCLKLALLVGYFVQIGQQMVVPDMADARHSGDDERLRQACWRSIKVPAVLSALALAGHFLLGRTFLGFFGPTFADGVTILYLLLAAQLFRALAGPGVHLLTLRGDQTLNIVLACSSLVVLCVASALLCPAYGPVGGAVAVLLVQVYWNLASIYALRRLGEPTLDILWAIKNRRSMSMRAVHL
jgi:O-antigen/teichoic acid export membrane protein